MNVPGTNEIYVKKGMPGRITFSDGHDTGIFSWDYLFELGTNHTDNWADYLRKLHNAGESRDPDVQVVKLS